MGQHASLDDGGLRGSFDGFVQGAPGKGHCNCVGTAQQLIGWAVDPSLPGHGIPPVTVDFSIDGAVPAFSAVANVSRPDLVKAGVAPNAEHGFLVAVPAEVQRVLSDGSRHALGASVGGKALHSPCAAFACTPADDTFEYIANGDVRLGADMRRGGSIGYFATPANPDPRHRDNVVNKHDMGREIQLSFYAGPDPINPGGRCPPGLFGKSGWPWNPIGAGDVDGNSGAVLEFTKTSSSYHIITRPLQWACHNVSCDCRFEQHVSLDGSAADIQSTVHMERSDTTDYGKMDQELLAVYANGPYYRLVTYNGSRPWSGDAVSEYVTGFRGPGAKGGAWIPGMFRPTEHWAALVDESGWGMGVINMGVDGFLGGFSGAKGKGGSDDGRWR